MKAVILAAGEGTRLRPITLTRPKHLIKICGKPILEYCLNTLKRCGVTEVIIVVYYNAKTIINYFGNGERLGLKIDYINQQGVFGTGNAVLRTASFVNDYFLLIYGDLLFSVKSLKKIIELYEKKKPAAILSVVPVEKPENYGIVELEGEEKVKRIIEKPSVKEAPTNLANAGLYVLSPEIFEKIKQTQKSIRGEYEITDALSILVRENQVLSIKIPRKDWFDIGHPWDLLEANRWILMKKKRKLRGGDIEEGVHITGKAIIAETARIRSGAYIEGPVFIDEESDIGPNCYIRPYTCIGKKVRVGNACEIKNSIIMDNTHIGHLSYVGDSVIGENCNLGAATVTANYRLDGETIKMMDKGTFVDTGRKKLGAILGDDVKAGVNTLIMPGVKIGNDSFIGPNVVIYQDLPSNTVVTLSQNLKQKKRIRN